MTPTYRVVLTFTDTAVPPKVLASGLTPDEAEDYAHRTAESLGSVSGGQWALHTDIEE